MSSLVTLGKTIFIDPAKPLPQYDNGPAKAYAAEDSTRTRGKNLIALLCDPAYVPRRGDLASYRGLVHPAAFVLVSNGVCDWPLTGDQRYCIVYERNFFEPAAVQNESKSAMAWRDVDVIDYFIKPIIAVLGEFEDRGVFHGSIRMSNLFYSQASKISGLILGDAFAVPPSSTQPIVYETIERAMAHPLGRGAGDHTDDVYAFGVCMAMLLRTIDPMEGMSDPEILDFKMQNGSYQALAGKDRLSGHILEILRGCLHDTAESRWKVSDLKSWVEGRRLTPQPPYRPKKAVRPIEFAGEKYHFARDLAYGMSKNSLQAQILIESGEILEWMERSVNDMEKLQALKDFLGRDMAKSRTKGNSAVLVSAVISILEPRFPVFYKDHAIFPNGAGSYIVFFLKNEKDISDIAEMILMNVFMSYVFLQHKAAGQSSLIKVFEACRLALNQVNIGYGFERCAYILCRDAPCLSAKFQRYFVCDVEQFLNAYERICERKAHSGAIFLDRHSTAYFSAHDSTVIDARLYDLNSKIRYQNIIANLRVLSAMQRRIKNSYYPHITRVLAEGMGDLLVRFHDRELRQRIEKDLAHAGKSGSVAEILETIDNPVVKNKDREDFRAAMREYAALREENRLIEEGMRNPRSFGQKSGQNFAALMSWLLAFVLMIVMTLFHFSGF